jgi:glycosyltransferase involved in cell wall biosynthesis
MVTLAIDAAGGYSGALRDHNAEPFYAMDLNERMLEQAGGHWWQVPEWNELDRVLADFAPELDASSLFTAHYKLSNGANWRRKMVAGGSWVIKDPRMSLTLPWWLKRFPNARVLWVQRDERDVVRSLLRRERKEDEAHSGLDEAGAVALCRAYAARTSQVLKDSGVDFRTVRYEELVHRDVAVQRKTWFELYQFVGTRPGQIEGFEARNVRSEDTDVTEDSTALVPVEEGPLVSVIVPNYNHEAFLDERIASILNQTYRNIEVLLMDDCSPDGSRGVLERWAAKDDRVKLMFSEENSGSPFAQWERGRNWAQGKYLWIAESDDAAALDMLEAHVRAMEANEGAAMVYSHSHIVDESGRFLRDFRADYAFIFGDASRWSSDFTEDGRKEVRDFMVYSNTIPNASGALFRKSIFDRVGAPETKWRLNGDWLFYARLLQHGDLIFLSKPRNYFRFHEKTQRSRAVAGYGAYDEILAMYDVFEREGWTSPERLNTAKGQVAMWWAGSVFAMGRNWSNFKNNFRLFRTFRPYRKSLGVYVVRQALIKGTGNAIKALGLKKPAKSLASRLFPRHFFPY